MSKTHTSNSTKLPLSNDKVDNTSEDNLIYKCCDSDYKDEEFIVEKQLTVKENKNIKDYSKKELFFYVIRSKKHKYGFAYITTQYIPLESTITGDKLYFVQSDLNKSLQLNILTNCFNQRYIEIFATNEDPNKSKKVKLNKTKFPINVQQLFFVYKKVNDDFKFCNDYNVHTKKFCIDRPQYHKKEIQENNISNIPKTIERDLLNDAVIDENIKKMALSSLISMNTNQYMQFNDHCLVLTNGGTGKSSIIGKTGTLVDKSSDAGIFGYYDVKQGRWISGLVSKTKMSIVLDELNELIGKKDTVEKLNTPLEQGSFSYSKAGGNKIDFGNKFLFLGNISDEVNMEMILQSIATNPLTFGRRIGFFVYDNNMTFINGKVRTKNLSKKVLYISEFLSEVFRYWIEIKHFVTTIQNNKKFNRILRETQTEMIKKINSIEHTHTKEFLRNIFSNSIRDRLPVMALKLAIIKLSNEYLNIDDYTKVHKSKLLKTFFEEYEKLIESLKLYTDNIIKHLENQPFNNTNIQVTKQEYDKLPKNIKNLLYIVCSIIYDFETNYGNKYPVSNPIKYDMIKEITKVYPHTRDIKYIKKNLKNGVTSTKTINEKLIQRGIAIQFKHNDLEIRISNYDVLKKYVSLLFENAQFNENNKKNPQTPNNDKNNNDYNNENDVFDEIKVDDI